MTTIAQVKRSVQPLLQRNPDLALVGRLIVVKPVHHIVRGIYIDRSLDRDLFVPTWALVFLFEPIQSFSFNWGERIYRPGQGFWDIADPETPAIMCETIERVALPLLRPIQTIDDFVGFASKERFNDTYLDLYQERRIFVDVARGDFDAARAICAYFATDRARRRYARGMEEEYERISKTLCPLVAAKDRHGLVRLLRDWEAYSVQQLKLERIWEPAPFPIESQLDQR